MKGAIEIMDGFEREQREQREQGEQSIVNIILIVMTVLGVLCIIYLAKKQNSPSYLVDNIISSTDKLKKRLSGRISDPASHKEASEIQAEFELVREKLIELKIKLKNKPWAN